MLSWQYGPKSLGNVSSILLNLCHGELSQFLSWKVVQPILSKLYLIKWPVSVCSETRINKLFTTDGIAPTWVTWSATWSQMGQKFKTTLHFSSSGAFRGQHSSSFSSVTQVLLMCSSTASMNLLSGLSSYCLAAPTSKSFANISHFLLVELQLDSKKFTLNQPLIYKTH